MRVRARNAASRARAKRASSITGGRTRSPAASRTATTRRRPRHSAGCIRTTRGTRLRVGRGSSLRRSARRSLRSTCRPTPRTGLAPAPEDSPTQSSARTARDPARSTPARLAPARATQRRARTNRSRYATARGPRPRSRSAGFPAFHRSASRSSSISCWRGRRERVRDVPAHRLPADAANCRFASMRSSIAWRTLRRSPLPSDPSAQVRNQVGRAVGADRPRRPFTDPPSFWNASDGRCRT